jgi:hypothetical protein
MKNFGANMQLQMEADNEFWQCIVFIANSVFNLNGCINKHRNDVACDLGATAWLVCCLLLFQLECY